MAQPDGHPMHLDASELGTKEYWDHYYHNELEQQGDDKDEEDDENEAPTEPSELDSWFDDVGAPAKTLAFLTSDKFPLSPNFSGTRTVPSVLDLGTGNGSALFSLRLSGGYRGPMIGVDFSPESIRLAQRLSKHYSESVGFSGKTEFNVNNSEVPWNIDFAEADLINTDVREAAWWPSEFSAFDLVLDKGTFDAISLSSETITDVDGKMRRICEMYPKKVADMLAPGGFFLITTCNWTEDEIIRWFTMGQDMQNLLEVFDAIRYPVFQFGGQKGQGVASVCFKRVNG